MVGYFSESPCSTRKGDNVSAALPLKAAHPASRFFGFDREARIAPAYHILAQWINAQRSYSDLSIGFGIFLRWPKTLGWFSELRGPKCATFVEDVGQLSLFSIQFASQLQLKSDWSPKSWPNFALTCSVILGRGTSEMYDYHTQLKLNLWYTFGRDVKVSRSRDQFLMVSVLVLVSKLLVSVSVSKVLVLVSMFLVTVSRSIEIRCVRGTFYLPFSVFGAVNTVWLFIRFVVLPLGYLDKVELTGRDILIAESPSAKFWYECEYFDHHYEFTITPILYSNCNRALVHVVALLTCSVNARCSCCWCHDGASDCQVDICSSILNSGNVFTTSLSFCILAAPEGR